MNDTQRRSMEERIGATGAFKETLQRYNEEHTLPTWQTVHHPFSARANLSEERTTDKG